MRKLLRKIFRKIILLILIFSAIAGILVWYSPIREVKTYGVTYAAFYAERFGLDAREAYLTIFDDLKIRHIRLPAYWNETEPRKDDMRFSELDWQLDEAARRGVQVILVVGRKLPRWPECHVPQWVSVMDQEEKQQELNEYITAVVERYKNHPAVAMWQVENEPFLPFGECPYMEESDLDAEITLVKSLDSKPIVITDSGELSIWVRAARKADVFGTTMYRIVYNDTIGHFTYPIPPSFFRLKRSLTRLVAGEKPMIVIELQGESWQKKMTYEVSVEEQYVSMNPEMFKDTLSYAKRTGFDTFYLWGVEWWYWLKLNGHPEIWDIVKEEVNANTF